MSGTLRIERLHIRYRLSLRHRAPALARASLDRDLRDRLRASCAAALAPALPAGDELVVIDRLDLRIALTGGAPGGRRLGAVGGRAIGREVARALAGEPEPSRIARYASRADYWACFLLDLARGSAGGRWQYAALGGLRAAPVGAAFREAPAQGAPVAAVLAALARRGRLGPVLAAVAEPDALALLDALEPAPGKRRPPAAHVLAAAAAPEAGRLGAAGLALFMAGTLAAQRGPEALVEAAARAMRLAAVVVAALRYLPATTGDGGSGAALRRGGAPARALAELERIDAELAAGVMRGAAPGGAGAPAGADGDVTPYGGIFLLLPGLADLDEERRLPAAGRFLVLAKCLPAESRGAAWHDPALCLASGLESAPRLADLRALGAPTPLPAPAGEGFSTWARWAEATLRAFARRLPRFQESSPGYLARNLLLGPTSYLVDEEGVRASLPQVPLRLVLRMSGWPGSDCSIPWLPGGRLRLGSQS